MERRLRADRRWPGAGRHARGASRRDGCPAGVARPEPGVSGRRSPATVRRSAGRTAGCVSGARHATTASPGMACRCSAGRSARLGRCAARPGSPHRRRLLADGRTDRARLLRAAACGATVSWCCRSRSAALHPARHGRGRPVRCHAGGPVRPQPAARLPAAGDGARLRRRAHAGVPGQRALRGRRRRCRRDADRPTDDRCRRQLQRRPRRQHRGRRAELRHSPPASQLGRHQERHSLPRGRPAVPSRGRAWHAAAAVHGDLPGALPLRHADRTVPLRLLLHPVFLRLGRGPHRRPHRAGLPVPVRPGPLDQHRFPWRERRRLQSATHHARHQKHARHQLGLWLQRGPGPRHPRQPVPAHAGASRHV